MKTAMRLNVRTLKLITGLVVALAVPSANAFLTIGESADVTPMGTLKIGVEPQIRLSEGSGANMSVFVDGALREDLSYRALLGAGETDLVLAGSMKWVPFPDFERQPAIGFRGDINVGRDVNQTFTTVRVAPIVSKQMQTDFVLFTPYAALPVGMQGYAGKTDTVAQLAIGSDIKPDEYPLMMFNVELGSNINRAFSYLSFNFVYLMGEDSSLKVHSRSKE